MLLSSKHRLTKILFVQEHIHRSTALTAVTSRSCVRCRRLGARAQENIIGNLPFQRLMPGFPFATVAVDFAGPFMIADRRGRSCKLTKAYLCLFICFRTKCVRYAFLLSLPRFISRRGKTAEIFCDNGRNFVAEAKVVGTFIRENSESISRHACDQDIKFVFLLHSTSMD